MANAAELPAHKRIRAEVEGHELELIESGPERLQTLIELIGAAKMSLRMIMYMFDDDRAGQKVRTALVAAARRGVDVTLLIDSFGSSTADPFFAGLKEAGGRYCIFNPNIGRRYLVRNHQKLIVIDDWIALIGGSNVDSSYMTDTGPKHWTDLWLKLVGPQSAVASHYFDTVFRWSTRKAPKLRPFRRTVADYSQWRGQLQWKFSGPLSRRNSWWRTIGRDMRKAKRLDMIFAYFAPPGAMLRRIGGVGRRGRARVITAAKSDNNATIAAARHSYSRLLRRNVEIYEYRAAKLHTKLVIVDDVVHIGSSNFDYRSFYLNLEIMLRIKDAGFADQMRGYFERQLENSEHITWELHKKRASWWLRIKWALSHFLVNVMDYTVTRRLNFRA